LEGLGSEDTVELALMPNSIEDGAHALSSENIFRRLEDARLDGGSGVCRGNLWL